MAHTKKKGFFLKIHCPKYWLNSKHHVARRGKYLNCGKFFYFPSRVSHIEIKKHVNV